MLPDVLAWLSVVVATFAAAGVFLSHDWRVHLGLMAALYAGAAALTASHWPIGMAAAFLVTGWMGLATVGMTLTGTPRQIDGSEQLLPEGRIFRLFMIGMVLVLAAGVAPRIDEFLPGIGSPSTACTVVLVGLGLLQIGTRTHIAAVVVGLLTILAGFQVFYSAVEGSVLVAGMLSATTLALGLAGAFLLSKPPPEDYR